LTQIKSVKYFAIVLCSVLILFAVACGPSRPSERDGQAAAERRLNQLEEVVKVDSLKKTDGQDVNVFGVQSYVMSYQATSECIAASGCAVFSTGGVDLVFSESYLAKIRGGRSFDDCTLFDRGAKFTTHGKLVFAKSEKGWTAQ
jgi:hypothetical protein